MVSFLNDPEKLTKIKTALRTILPDVPQDEFDAAWDEAITVLKDKAVVTASLNELAESIEGIHAPDATIEINKITDLRAMLADSNRQSDEVWQTIETFGVVALKIAARVAPLFL